jgi:5-methyltetrahydrofolate--homocysteine methyltransferase
VQNLTAADFGGPEYEGCNEYLVITKPEAVAKVHRGFLEAGADVIETDTFGGTSIVLAEYDLADRAYELNKTAANWRKVADEFSTPEKPRFVAGSMGPGTKLPTLGHIDFDTLKAAYVEQARGLIDGGVDLMLVETCQDVLQIKAALNAIEEAFEATGKRLPLMVSVTMEQQGTMLVGTEMAAALAILEPYPIDILGLNCATGPGPDEGPRQAPGGAVPLRHFLHPQRRTAGERGRPGRLPPLPHGAAHGPDALRRRPGRAGDRRLLRHPPRAHCPAGGDCQGSAAEGATGQGSIQNWDGENTLREGQTLQNSHSPSPSPPPDPRPALNYVPSSASIYSPQPYDQDNSFLIVGERLNASGSKKCRTMLNDEDWDGLVALARSQVKEGAHVLDVNVDYVGAMASATCTSWCLAWSPTSPCR